MLITILRHGTTEGNLRGAYVGSTDLALCELGEAELRRLEADSSVTRVYVSPLLRARQTAEILFPSAQLEVVDGLREMDFGHFENRSAAEMENDAEYRAWVEGMCADSCPGGESMEAFSERVAGALADIINTARERGESRVTIVAHGGTIMAAMARYALDERDYFEWTADNGGGYEAAIVSSGDTFHFEDVKKVEGVKKQR